jgi:hypothetical protein
LPCSTRSWRRSAPSPAPDDTWVALDRVRDPGNLGTIIRTADAAGASGVILIGETVDPFSTETVRATMGSVFAVPLARATEAEFLSWSKKTSPLVVGSHLKGSVDYRTIGYKGQPVVLLDGQRAGRACPTRWPAPAASWRGFRNRPGGFAQPGDRHRRHAVRGARHLLELDEPAHERERASALSRIVPMLTLVGGAVGLDQLIKWLVETRLPFHELVPVMPMLRSTGPGTRGSRFRCSRGCPIPVCWR